MSLSKLVVTLDLDGRKFSSSLNVARAELQGFEASVNRTDATVRRSRGGFTGWGRTLRDTVVTLGELGDALFVLEKVFIAPFRNLTRQNAEIEKMRYLMAGLSSEVGSFAEKMADADKVVGEIFNIAQNSPTKVDALTDAYVKMKAGGIDPLAGSLQALNDGVAQFGGDTTKFHRASVAIQQMAGKGVISMEELRQQLGEAIPSAIQVMARGLNMTVGDLARLVATGTVEAKSAIQAFSRQMDLEMRGAAARMANTWDGLMARLGTQWTLLANEIGKAGYFEEVKEALRVLVEDVMSSSEIRKFAKDLGNALTSAIRGVKAFGAAAIPVFSEVSQWIKTLAAVLIAAKFRDFFEDVGQRAAVGMGTVSTAIARTVSVVSSAPAAWRNYQAAVRNTAMVNYMMNQAQGAQAAMHPRLARLMAHQQVLMTRLGAAYATATTAVRAFATAAVTAMAAAGRAIMGFFGGPIGLMLISGAALHEMWDRLIGRHKRFREQVISGGSSIIQSEKDLLKVYEEMNKQLQRRTYLEENLRRRGVYGASRQQARIDAINEEINQLGMNAAEARPGLVLAAAESEFRRLKTRVSEEMVAARGAYREAIEQAQKEAEQFSTTEERMTYIGAAKEEALTKLRDITLRTWERALADETARIEQAEKTAAADGKVTEEEKLAIDTRKRMLEMLKDEVHEVREGIDMMDEAQLTLISMTGETKKSALENYLDNIKIKIEQTRARLEETGTEVAKVTASIEAGKFKGDKGQRDEALEQARIQDELIAKLKARTEAQNQLNHILERSNALATQSGRRLDTAENDNEYLQAAASMRSYGEEALRLRDNLQKLIDEGRVVEGQMGAAVNALDQLANAADTFSEAGIVAGMKRATDSVKEYRRSWMSASEAAVDRIREQRAEFQAFIRDAGELSPAMQAEADAFLDVLDKQEAEAGSSILSLMKEWEVAAQDMADVWRSAFEGASDAIADFIVTGEASIGDFLENIAKMVVRSGVQELIATGVTSLMSGWRSTPSTGSGRIEFGSSPNTGGFMLTSSANGNIMTAKGPVTLQKYARGGIAHTPQLSLFGEGSQPEAYVPLPDGRTIPVTLEGNTGSGGPANLAVQVNVINQSGEQVESSEQNQRFDGEKYIVDVVLRNATRPGPMRDAFRSIK